MDDTGGNKPWVMVAGVIIIALVIFIVLVAGFTRSDNAEQKDKVSAEPVKSTVVNGEQESIDYLTDSGLDMQRFSDSELGISFDFPANWPRPIVEGDSILFENSLEISLGKSLLSQSDSGNTIVTQAPQQSGQTVTIAYNPDEVNSGEVEEIVNSIDTSGPSPTSADPTPTIISGPTLVILPPTPDPTLFFQSSENCTYGCVNQDKFQ